ncbi:MAG: hypothetical protein HYY96_08450 [Candidatus Tectomicrobia bacterium]|nr:hypothetical protein [Candidatus Tectomicrobia bacterium]
MARTVGKKPATVELDLEMMKEAMTWLPGNELCGMTLLQTQMLSLN